ncbi:rho GTPase-activating protein 100F-like isoform X3 [Portunus trituberculatus]|uniref:rho GTPase-activating protein 100F-like isoform X3 n=1 Tax=Portunus trituberculatus TaxID=210409 RepID=UPI001E1CEFB5|nr:rho GTPase-activating protein 100F-like isoform X3 [Portunus trituberculatus]
MCDVRGGSGGPPHYPACGCLFNHVGSPSKAKVMEGSNGVGAELAASPRRQVAGPSRGRDPPSMVVQGDFRKVSGISTEIFRQIETVENDHDASTAAALDVVERRGEMVVRLLDPRTLSRSAYEQAKRFLAAQNVKFSVQMVEIVKRPGQTLGLYIREGNGADRAEGVFISRIALESPVYNSGCLRVGDEILAVNLVDVTRMGLDDVVIIMSIPRRLLLTTRSRRGGRGAPPSPQPRHEPKPPPVVVIKKEYEEEPLEDSNSNGDTLRFAAMGRPPPPPSRPPPGVPQTQESRFSTLPRYRPPETMSALRHEEPLMYYGARGMPGKGPYGVPQPGPPGSQPGVLVGPMAHATHPGYQPRSSRQPGLPGAGMQPYGAPQRPPMGSDRERYYQPPPPVITEQPRPQHQQHFTPYERSYPKTLESLAERVHAFYGSAADDGMGPPPLGVGDLAVSVRQGRPHEPPMYGTLGRSSVGRPRLARTLSDQRLPATERESLSDYEGSGPSARRHKASTLQYPSGAQVSDRATLERYQETMRRLSALRQRTRSVDYASDTEVTLPRSSLLARARGAQGVGAGGGAARSNSLPRHSSRHRGGSHVRFEARGGPAVSEDESDGAVSAPEMPTGTERAARRARLPSSPSIFTSDEYRAWMSRAPSTSAIYERIRQSHETLRTQRGGLRFTYSADNLTDKSRDEAPYYMQRLHLGPGAVGAAGSATRQLGRLEGQSRRMRAALEEARGVPHPSPTRGRPALRLIDINPAEFLKYKVGVGNMGGVSEGVSGMLWVHLLAGRGLKAAGRSEFRDLYCVLECDRVHKARTVVRTGDLNFDWDETFDLDLINNKELDFLIYSWDPQFRHKLCYKGSVHLVSLLKESPLHQLALKIEPRGTLYLKLRYTPPRQAFLRTPSVRKNSLFGVDLDTVSNRESGGGTVPLIIARCVAEVERRGLDIIGLYRLCGSATKKRLLRDAFERNPRLVDLSSDNVPDINVITGILKDYLRELPEPLFTKCLYQMLVDALTVMLPDDPQGNAKLMFSILDCLPKVNRVSQMTLFLLMDHLRLVASQSERNKMTTQNLAICFGPVLMLQSESEDPMDFHQPISILKFLLDLWPSKSAREAEAANARSARPSHLDPGRRKVGGPGSRMTTPRTTPRTTPTSQSPGSESDSSPNPPVNLRPKLVLGAMATTSSGGDPGSGAASGPSAPGSTSTTSTPTSSITSPPSTTAAPTSSLPAGSSEAASTLTATRGLDPETETEEDKDGAETASS